MPIWAAKHQTEPSPTGRVSIAEDAATRSITHGSSFVAWFSFLVLGSFFNYTPKASTSEHESNTFFYWISGWLDQFQNALAETLGGDLAVPFLYLNADCTAVELFGSYQCRAGTHERVEYHMSLRIKMKAPCHK